MSSRITRTVWNPEDPGRTGHWGKATSTIDWCERNYEYSPYIAEMFNTVSNLGFILISVWGLWRIRQQRLPRRLAAAFLGVMIVGVGSAMFHGSLQMEAQAADELPMIYAALLLFYVVFDSTPVGKTPSALPPLALTAFGVVYTYSYYVYPHPVIHEIVYGLILGVTTLRCAWLLNFRPLKTDIERKINNQAWWMESFGAFFFLLAFAIWNVDNWRCVPLTKLKDELGAPTKWLLEGHAWWHIFTMISTFLILSSAGLLSLSIRGHPEHFKLSYDLGIIPWIERTEKGWQALKETERRKKE